MAPLGAGVAGASLALLIPAWMSPSPPAGLGSAGAAGSEGPSALPSCAGAAIDRPGCIAAAALLCNSLSSLAPPVAPAEGLEGLGGCQSGLSPAGAGAPLFLQGWGMFALSVPGLCPPAPGSVPHQPGLGILTPQGLSQCWQCLSPSAPTASPPHCLPIPVPPLSLLRCPITARSNAITSYPPHPCTDHSERGLERETEAGRRAQAPAALLGTGLGSRPRLR